MAVVLQVPPMGAEAPADRTVHPFFTTRRDRAHSQLLDEYGSGPSPLASESLEPDSELKTSVPAVHERKPKEDRRPRKRKSDEKAPGAQPKLDFGPHENGALHVPGNADSVDSEAKSHSGDESDLTNPNKRRKTASPAPPAASPSPQSNFQPGWEEQLLEAAFAGSSPPVEKARTPVVSGEMAEALQSRTNPTPPADTPPKKVMRLRTDGRLISPKAKQDNQIEAGKKQDKRTKSSRKQALIVVLKYSQDGSRFSLLGQKIEDILAGRTRALTVEKHAQPARAPPTQPPKATHPFFTGKPTRAKILATADSSHEESDASTTRARSASPKKRAAISSSWAGFGSSFTKQPKLPGSMAAPWPPRDTFNVRGLPHDANTYESPLNLPKKRLKGSQIQLPIAEEVLGPLRLHIQSAGSDALCAPAKHFHHPRRRLMSGLELQRTLRGCLVSQMPVQPIDNNQVVSEDELVRPPVKPSRSRPHDAVTSLYRQLQTSMSAFDLFECEQREWAHKYAPQKIEHVLHGDADLPLFRDWLLGLTVNAVSSRSADSGDKVNKKPKPKKKKRKAASELEGFIVFGDESDGSGDSDTEGTGLGSSLRRLSPRNISKTKAVVLSGPHGCGKTASVYAAARELGFEVFEISSGVRRSGRDLLDKVGDMTQNHLVERSKDPSDGHEPDEPVLIDAQADVESGRQSTMNSFFASTANSKMPPNPSRKKVKPEPVVAKKASKKQKQSLILLEEVDILFEEDRHFWTTVVSMLLETRRPVVMTCTDESLIPAEELMDTSALYMPPASESTTIDYLLLIAANEGHLISREAMTELFRARGNDLRASIAQLNFTCQMALGDEKGGLEWMLIRSNTQQCHNSAGEPLRVISEHTFVEHMPISMDSTDGGSTHTQTQLDRELNVLSDAHAHWDLDPEDWLSESRFSPPPGSLEALQKFESATEALSASDILPGSSFLEPDAALLDPTLPPLSDKERLNFTQGYLLAETPLRADSVDLSLHITFALKILARPLLGDKSILDAADVSTRVLNAPARLSDMAQLHATELTAAISPLSIPPPSTVFTNSAFRPSPSLLPSTSASTIATDIAPFVRSIAVADLKLEQDRLRLSGLLSQGGRDGKRARTTRAARAALEGGKKESTRKERWFGIEVNYTDVVGTGGKGWGAAQAAETQERERARQDAEVHIQEQVRAVSEEGDSLGP